MKNFFTFILVACVFAFSANAQQLNLDNSGAKKHVIGKASHNLIHSSKTTTIFSEDFEGGAMPTGWSEELGSATSGWTFNTDASSEYFAIPAHTVYAAINDDECNCDMSDVWLVTPAIDLSTATAPRLSFQSFLHVYSGIFTLKASIDGGTTWSDVTTFSTGDEWTAELVDLAAYAGESLTLAFHYNDGAAWDYGWAIDDVVVFEPDAHDLGVTAITPSSYAMTGEAVTPTVTIENYGATDEATWSVQLTDGAGYDQTVSDDATVVIGGSYVITFPDWTPASSDDYTLTATLTLTDDGATDNNELTTVVAVDDYFVAQVANSSSASGTVYLGTDYWATQYNSGVDIFGGVYAIDKLYGITEDGDFGYFDAAVETWTGVGASGITGETFVISMAYDAIGAVYYTLGLSGSYPNFQINLYSINPTTGAGTLVATSSTTGTLLAIACDATGNLYGIMHSETGNGTLYQINKSDASMTLVGDMGGAVSSYFQSMAFDLETNDCYFQAFDDEGGFNGTYMINTTSGATTVVGTSALPGQITALGIPYDFVSNETVMAENNVDVYPNPANDVVVIENSENATVTIINMVGQVVVSQEMTSNRESVNISDLSEGTYIIRVENGAEVNTQKLNIIR